VTKDGHVAHASHTGHGAGVAHVTSGHGGAVLQTTSGHGGAASQTTSGHGGDVAQASTLGHLGTDGQRGTAGQTTVGHVGVGGHSVHSSYSGQQSSHLVTRHSGQSGQQDPQSTTGQTGQGLVVVVVDAVLDVVVVIISGSKLQVLEIFRITDAKAA